MTERQEYFFYNIEAPINGETLEDRDRHVKERDKQAIDYLKTRNYCPIRIGTAHWSSKTGFYDAVKTTRPIDQEDENALKRLGISISLVLTPSVDEILGKYELKKKNKAKKRK